MSTFLQQLLRLKQELNVDTDHEVAEALGYSTTALSERKRRGAFPVDRVCAVAPRLAIDPMFVIYGHQAERQATPQITAAEDSFTPPTFEQMATFMDAEMARMGITQPVADVWGAAA